jgi:RNA polymerase sigma-70 factor (ECF subfamily)
LPSRRQHKTDPNKSALQMIMGEVDDLSRDALPAADRGDDD